jgi:DNA repair protein RadC
VPFDRFIPDEYLTLITPSEADIKITKKLVDAGKLLEIAVLDHLIIGQDQFYSFADEGSL